MLQEHSAFNTALSDWMMVLYKQSFSLHWTQFKPWFFKHLTEIVDFDSGFWFSRSDLGKRNNIKLVEDTCVFNLPLGFIENYVQQVSDCLNPAPFSVDFITKPEKPFSSIAISKLRGGCNDIETGFHQQVFAKYNIGEVNAFYLLPGENSVLGHLFYLFCKAPDLSKSQKFSLDLLLPHLAMSFQLNLNTIIRKQNKISTMAFVDRFGEIIAAQDDFVPFMRTLNLYKNARIKLPQLPAITRDKVLTIKNAKVALKFHQGIILIEARTNCLLPDLSPRQREICELITKGLTNKEIAECLGLKSNTVNNHVQNVLATLKVRSREAATVYFNQQLSNENP